MVEGCLLGKRGWIFTPHKPIPWKERQAAAYQASTSSHTHIHTQAHARPYVLELEPVGVAAGVVLLGAEVGAVVDDVVAQGHLDLVVGDSQLKGGVRLEQM